MEVEARLASLLMETHPDDAAGALEGMPVEQAAAAIGAVPEDLAARVVGRMQVARAADCLRYCSEDGAAKILAAIPVQTAILILRQLDPQDRERLFGRMEAKEVERLRRVMAYPAGTAGALMDTAVVAFPEDVPVGEILRRARRQPQKMLYYVYVTDRDQKLLGVLTLRELMHAPPGRSVGEIGRRPVKSLRVDDPQAVVLGNPAWKTHHALPVVDDSGVLAGVLRYDTLRRLEAEATTERPPDLLDLGAALTETWANVATLLFDGFGRALTAARDEGRGAPGASDEEPDV
jgi:magnesium transporter